MWVKLDDHFDQHPKFAKVGPLGIALWTAGLAYCNRQLTDGFIPWAAARSLVSWEFLEADGRISRVTVTSGMAGDEVDSSYVIALLLSAGLWEEVHGGYLVHDYTDYQPTKAQVEADRKATASRVAKWRSNAVTNSRDNGVSNTAPVTRTRDPLPDTRKPEPKSSGRKRGEELLADEGFSQPLRERFSSLDWDFETGKWLDFIETKPPKGNYKLSLKNWLERAERYAPLPFEPVGSTAIDKRLESNRTAFEAGARSFGPIAKKAVLP